MKITIYTINDCKFSQAEKQYLTSKNMQFEEKNLETNREYLTEMLNISNNFAGTPVTKIEKDDGTSVVLKGFTPSEFDAALGLVTDPTTAAEPKAEETVPPAESSSMPQAAVNTAAVAQATTGIPASTPDMSMQTPPVSSMEQTAPSPIDMSMSTPTEPTTPEASPVSSTPEPVAPPAETPVMPSMSDPMPMTPSSMDSTTPTPSMNDVMSQPQGEAIPGTPITDSSPSMNTSVDQSAANPIPQQSDMSMGVGQAPNLGDGNNQQQAAANDPLSSVLNDLQSKGNNN